VERHREEPSSAWGRRAESQFREDLLRISKKVATNRYANNCGSEVLIDKVETDRAVVFFDCGDESP
jgi:hypothetical protein